MAVLGANLIKESASGTGTGDLTVTGAQTSFFPFSAYIPNNSIVYYSLLSGTEREVGYGVFTAPSTISRVVVFQSSNGGAKLVLGPGEHEVIFTIPYEKLLFLDENDRLADPSPFRNSVSLATITDGSEGLLAEAGVIDDELTLVASQDLFDDYLGGFFRFNRANNDPADGFMTYVNVNEVNGRHERQLLYIQSPFYFDRFDFSPKDTAASEVRHYNNNRTSNPNDYFALITDASGMQIVSRFNQAGAVNFMRMVSSGDDEDRIIFDKPFQITAFAGDPANLLNNTFFGSGNNVHFKAADGSSAPISRWYGVDVEGEFDTMANFRAFDAAAEYGTKTQYSKLFGRDVPGDITRRLYKWVSGDSSAHDGHSVIRPTVGAAASGPGRHLLVAGLDVNNVMTATDTTPSVALIDILITAGGDQIIDFDDGHEGQELLVVWGGVTEISIADNANIATINSTPINLGTSQRTAMFRHIDGVWRQVGGAGLAAFSNIAYFDIANGADQTSAMQAAIDDGKDLIIGPGTWTQTATLTMDNVGQSISGALGGADTVLEANFDGGPVINILERKCVIRDLTITADNTRNALTYAGDNHGMVIGGETAGTLTATKIERVVITRQPGDAFAMYKAGSQTVFDQCSAQYNRGHGFFFDDGTRESLTVTARCGIVNLASCRSVGNGGNAVNCSPAGSTCYRFIFDNMETTNNAWNTAIPGLFDAQFDLRGNNFVMIACAFGDPDWADTVQPNGDSRLAKGGAGISYNIGSSSKNVQEIACRHIETSQSAKIGNNTIGLIVENPYLSAVHGLGYDIGTGCDGAMLHLPDPSMYTIAVDSETDGNRVTLGNDEGVTVAGTNELFFPDKITDFAIAASTVNATTGTVNVTGTGNISGVYFAGGSNPLPDGFKVSLVNDTGADMGLIHGTGNLNMPDDFDGTLKAGSAVNLVARNGDVHVIGGPDEDSSAYQLVELELGSAATLASGLTVIMESGATPDVVIPEDGRYMISAAACIRHLDDVTQSYEMRVMYGTGTPASSDLHGYKSYVGDGSANVMIDQLVAARPVWLTAGTYRFQLAVRQLAQNTAWSQVLADNQANAATHLSVLKI